MPLQTSGPISLSNIGAEFQNSAPYSMSEFYGAAAGIPTSGAIRLGNFYGATASKIETITIPASETGYLFTGDAKYNSANLYSNIAATRYVTSTAYPLQIGNMYTKYSSFAAQLGYSSILIEIESAFTGGLAGIDFSTGALVHLTNLPPNTAVASDYVGVMGGAIGVETNGSPFLYKYKVAGKELIKKIKITKAGASTTLDICQFDSMPANTAWGDLRLPWFDPIVLPYPTNSNIGRPTGYSASEDLPLNYALGQQQYSVEIEWL